MCSRGMVAANETFPAFADDECLASTEDGHFDDGAHGSIHTTSRVAARGHDGESSRLTSIGFVGSSEFGGRSWELADWPAKVFSARMAGAKGGMTAILSQL